MHCNHQIKKKSIHIHKSWVQPSEIEKIQNDPSK